MSRPSSPGSHTLFETSDRERTDRETASRTEVAVAAEDALETEAFVAKGTRAVVVGDIASPRGNDAEHTSDNSKDLSPILSTMPALEVAEQPPENQEFPELMDMTSGTTNLLVRHYPSFHNVRSVSDNLCS
jgi:hypothetical protein